MKTLYFIRHAESEANRNRILGSRLQYPLTAEGKLDSERIAAELKQFADIDCIISSPLRRAIQTAGAFAAVYELEILKDERVSEQELGIFSGLSYDEVKLHPDYEKEPLKRWTWTPDGGESYSMIAERITDFLEDIGNQKGENILIVTHAVALRLITAALKNSLPDYPEAFPNNGEILKVEFAGLGKCHALESISLGNSREFAHNP